MTALPSDGRIDATLALLADPYRYIGTTARRLGADGFRSRVMLRPVVCMTGSDAAEFFYGGDRFTRVGAMPSTTLRLLQDVGSVQSLDGSAHLHRKKLFLDLQLPDQRQALRNEVARAWRSRLAELAGRRIVLFDQARRALGLGVCRWAGIPEAEIDPDRRIDELAAMVDNAGSIGPSVVRALLLRRRAERWAEGLVERVRSARMQIPPDSPLARIAAHRDLDGKLLETSAAAVELLNLLRPTQAIDRFLAFAGHALVTRPELLRRMRGADDAVLRAFVLEVRRFYPYFPLIGGRTKGEAVWHDHRFAPGDWVLLDLFGTNHDPRIWPDPEAFQPERFLGREPTAFDYLPQGGGAHGAGHRCPGEWATIEIMIDFTRELIDRVAFEVPDQELSIGAGLPPRVVSGVVLDRLRPVGASGRHEPSS